MIVRFFPDMSAEVARCRAEFKDVKAALRNAGITYGMLHPARLRVDFQGQHVPRCIAVKCNFKLDAMHRILL